MGLDASVKNWAYGLMNDFGDPGYYLRLIAEDLNTLWDQGIRDLDGWNMLDPSCPHRGRIGSYGTIHLLRRAVNDTLADLGDQALERRGIHPDDPDLSFTNLIHHSDCDGVYYPLDFEKDETDTMIGSSIALAREMELARRLLEIPADAEVDDFEVSWVNAKGEAWNGWGQPPREFVARPGRYARNQEAYDGPRWVWCHFNRFVQASVEHKLPLHFH